MADEKTAGSLKLSSDFHTCTPQRAHVLRQKKNSLTPVIIIKLLSFLLIIKNLHGSKVSSFFLMFCFFWFGGEGICLFIL